MMNLKADSLKCYNYIFTVYFLASIIQFKPPNEIVQKLNYSANVLKTKLIKTGC